MAVDHGGCGERHEQSTNAGCTDANSTDGHGESHEPAEGGEQREEEVVEGEHLVAQHRQPVEVLGAFLVLDGGHRRLQAGHVRLEGDADPVAEAALQAVEQNAQVPGGRRRRAEADGGDQHLAAVALGHAVGQQLQPQRQQRVGQRREQHHGERGRQQPGLGPVAQLERPPQRARTPAAVDRQASVGVMASTPPRRRRSTLDEARACSSNIVR